MATFIPTGALAAMNAAGSSAAPDLAQDFTLAQLDIIAAASGGAMHAVSNGAVDPFVFRFSIFVIAIFVGALLAVGVALVTGDKGPIWARVLGFIALVFASVNIFGGFLVTQRMLGMYQKKK